jgi:hypothetical protein
MYGWYVVNYSTFLSICHLSVQVIRSMSATDRPVFRGVSVFARSLARKPEWRNVEVE